MRVKLVQKVTEKTDKFLWLGNDPAIDFVNTAIVSDGKPVDLLQGPDDYLAWLNQAGLELRFTDKGRQQLKAGYQHATHIYEGEGKVLGVQLKEILDKHRAVLAAPDVALVTQEFNRLSLAVYQKYADRIVGF